MDERPWIMDTEDRNAQVNWLRNQAYNLSSYGHREDGDGAARVADWEEQCHANREPLPVWYDDHDRRLLIGWIDESLNS